MPSASRQRWLTERAQALDEIQSAHARVGGTARGRRYATQQINHAYVVLLSSQFQGFCRDLHTECLDYLVVAVTPAALQVVLRAEALRGRRLDKANPSPGNIGEDFNRLGFAFWAEVSARDGRAASRQRSLGTLNLWRNAIAHQDFDPSRLGGRTTVQLAEVRRWHAACDGLAQTFDAVLQTYLTSIVGPVPW